MAMNETKIICDSCGDEMIHVINDIYACETCLTKHIKEQFRKPIVNDLRNRQWVLEGGLTDARL